MVTGAPRGTDTLVASVWSNTGRTCPDGGCEVRGALSTSVGSESNWIAGSTKHKIKILQTNILNTNVKFI